MKFLFIRHTRYKLTMSMLADSALLYTFKCHFFNCGEKNVRAKSNWRRSRGSADKLTNITRAANIIIKDAYTVTKSPSRDGI